MFRIFETSEFQKNLVDDFQGPGGYRVRKKLVSYVYPQLRQNPYFGKNIKKLKGYDPETWRYRIGDYRFFYTIEDRSKTVYMIATDNRQSAY